jgi:hypothetical protein
MSGFNGFPGMGAAPGGMPAATAPGGAGFILDIPPDPTWTPIEETDTLEKDGYYYARVTKESVSSSQDKSPGVFFYFELLDDDVKGKVLSKKMPDSSRTNKQTWWLWRSLIRAVQGGLATAQAGFRYTPGMFVGQIVCFRTEAYLDDGAIRTGVGAYVTQQEYADAVKAGKHRWEARPPKTAANAGSPVGALPGGSPFPGLGGLPGAPAAPSAPVGAPPMFPAAPPAGSVAPAPAVAPFAPQGFAPAAAQTAPAFLPQAPQQQVQQPSQAPQQQPQQAPAVGFAPAGGFGPGGFVPGQAPPPGSVAPWQPAQPPAAAQTTAPQPAATAFAFPGAPTGTPQA